MVRMTIAAMALAVLGAGADAQPQAPGSPAPGRGQITEPDWIARPAPADLLPVYPPLARNVGLSGKVVLKCTVAVEGTVSDCIPLSEAPVGLGFGLAAARLSSTFRMKPRMIDGVPVGGATVNIPVTFRMADKLKAPQIQSRASPEAVALGRRVVVARGDLDALERDFGRQAAQFAALASLNTGLGPQVQKARALAYDAYAQGQKESLPALLDIRARNYADNFSEAELREMLAFYEGPIGRAVRDRQPRMIARVQLDNQAMMLIVQAAAAKAFCKQAECVLRDPPTSGLLSELVIEVSP